MRKILLVHNDIYLDRALEDVSNLIELERRWAGNDGVVELLAVILAPMQGLARLLPEGRTCELSRSADNNSLFGPDSIAVSGMWLLLTVSQSDLLEPTARQDALCRILDILRTKGFLQSLNSVLPVFRFGEKELPRLDE